MRRLLRLAALPLLLVADGCAPRAAALRLAAGTPIVVVSIDTLRSDHLPAYGYAHGSTPAIDELRRDAILFERAFAHVPLTLPSHTSLLTGLLPADAGVRDNVGYALAADRVERGEIPYLPERLHRLGYATAGGVSAYVLRGSTGLRTGFDLYEDSIEARSGRGLGALQRPARDTLAALLPWLRQHAGGPFFLFLHLYEPHAPYEPPAELAARAGSPYDGEIALADQTIGELLGELRRLGLYDRALVVLLSDHGEGLGDHDEDEHGVLLYREAIQVPLLLKLPGARFGGRSVATPVGLFDVAPTIHALLGLERPPGWRGASLLSFLDAPEPARRIYSETYYPRLHLGASELTSLLDGRFHLIAGPASELFALDRDAAERHDVLRDERRAGAELQAALSDYVRDLAPPAPADAETLRALAALGYLGATGEPPAGSRRDPRAELPNLARLRAAYELAQERKWAESLPPLRALVASNPHILDAWELLGRALVKCGRPEEALAAYEEAVRRSGGTSPVTQDTASLLFELGRLDEAAAHARLVEPSAPTFAHGLLARIAMRRGDLAGAEREARFALDGAADPVLPGLTLAEILRARGREAEAQEALRTARAAASSRRAADPGLTQGTRLLEGMALADLGDVAAAEEAFADEMRRFPEDPRAWANLALLQALTGRQAEAGDTLRRMVDQIASADAYAAAAGVLRALHDDRGAEAVLAAARRKFPDSTLITKLALRP